MKKKVLSTILAGVFALSAFAGCGSSNTGECSCRNKRCSRNKDAAVADTRRQKVKQPRAADTDNRRRHDYRSSFRNSSRRDLRAGKENPCR